MRKLAISRAIPVLLLVTTLVLTAIAEASIWSSPSMIAEDCFNGKASISGDGSKIAFQGGSWEESNIFVINSDGTELTQLTNSTADDRAPSISGDGSKIAFIRQSSLEGSPEIFVINSDGTGLKQLTDNPDDDYFVSSSNPSISGDGSKVAFQRMSFKTWDRGIFVINSDGTGEKMLTNITYYDEYPSINDDGSKIAFRGGDDFDWQIFVINSDGTGLTQLTHNTGEWQTFPSRGPVISGDGSKVAFMGWDGSAWEIFVVNSDGSGLKQLTDNSPQLEENAPPPYGPSISGDGRKVAFNNFVESDFENRTTEIFVVNSDGTGLTQLTHNTKWNTGPAICDNGEKIAFRGCFKTDEGWDNDLFVVTCLSDVETEDSADGNVQPSPSDVEAEDGVESVFPTEIVMGGIVAGFVLCIIAFFYLKRKESYKL